MNNEKIANIGDRIRDALKARNMRQADLIEQTGISSGKISSYISGRYKPKYETLRQIADALNVSEIWLSGYDVPMEKEKENKNDDLVKIVARLRKDNDFYAACIALYNMNAEQLNSVRDLIAAFKK